VCVCVWGGGWKGVDGYHKRDPEILSKHLPKDVSNGRGG
jgi:hypothetical protein